MNASPKIHNAVWPGVVGKSPEEPGNEPISLETMLDYTAAADVGGRKFDGVDIFLFDPHISIDATDEELENVAEMCRSRNLNIGTVVAPVWEPTGGGSSMGSPEEVERFLTQVRKGCTIANKMRQLGVRPYGCVRIDSAASPPAEWLKDPEGNQAKIADTFKAACDIAEEFGERLAAEGEICWAGMHSWRKMVDLLERVGRPEQLGFQADMAHTLLYLMGYNAPEDRILPEDFDWSDTATKEAALKELTAALRPWTIDFHVAQNDGTVHGTGSHDKTGRHCLPDDPNGRLDIARDAAFWMRDEH
ncbi:MAG: TIM barrel protein, partial [Planctomycetota bacterium]